MVPTKKQFFCTWFCHLVSDETDHTLQAFRKAVQLWVFEHLMYENTQNFLDKSHQLRLVKPITSQWQLVSKLSMKQQLTFLWH